MSPIVFINYTTPQQMIEIRNVWLYFLSLFILFVAALIITFQSLTDLLQNYDN